MNDIPNTIGPQLSRLQKQELQETLKAMLGPSKVHSTYTEVVDEALEVKLDIVAEYHNSVSLANDYLRDEIQELWYQRVDELIESGEIPQTEGQAQDVLDDVVRELSEIVHEQIIITSEDVHDYKQRRRERNERLGLDDEADRLYEARKEGLL